MYYWKTIPIFDIQLILYMSKLYIRLEFDANSLYSKNIVISVNKIK